MRLLTTLLLLLIALGAWSQDKLYFKSGDVQEVKIKEIGPSVISYYRVNTDSDILMSVLRDDLLRVVFENGDIMVMMDDLDNPNLYSDQKKNALKVEFLSPLLGHTALVYERLVEPGLALEGGISLIGLGSKPEMRNPKGIGFKFGVKFIKQPDFKVSNARYSHVLHGAYIRPELSVAFFEDRYMTFSDVLFQDVYKTANISYGVLSVNLGKQWVFQDLILMDIYGGAGYGLLSSPEDYNYSYRFGSVGPNEPFGIVFTGGFRIGVLIR